jgi:putative transposase
MRTPTRRAEPSWTEFLRPGARDSRVRPLSPRPHHRATGSTLSSSSSTPPRRVHILGITVHPTGAWATSRRETVTGPRRVRRRFRFMIRDREPSSPPRSTRCSPPSMSARSGRPCERHGQRDREHFVGSIRRELLDRILINQRHAATVPGEYQHHYNSHRPHRALRQTAPPRPLRQGTTSETNTVQRRDRLGGLLHEYRAGRMTCGISGTHSLDDPSDPAPPGSHRHRCGRPPPVGGSSCAPRPPACWPSTKSRTSEGDAAEPVPLRFEGPPTGKDERQRLGSLSADRA